MCIGCPGGGGGPGGCGGPDKPGGGPAKTFPVFFICKKGKIFKI